MPETLTQTPANEAADVARAQADADAAMPKIDQLQAAIGAASGSVLPLSPNAPMGVPVQVSQSHASFSGGPVIAENIDRPVTNPMVKGLQMSQLIGNRKQFFCEDCGYDDKAKRWKVDFIHRDRYESHLAVCPNKRQRDIEKAASTTAAATIKALVEMGVIQIKKEPTHGLPAAPQVPSQTTAPVVPPGTSSAGPTPQRKVGRPRKSLAN